MTAHCVNQLAQCAKQVHGTTYTSSTSATVDAAASAYLSRSVRIPASSRALITDSRRATHAALRSRSRHTARTCSPVNPPISPARYLTCCCSMKESSRWVQHCAVTMVGCVTQDYDPGENACSPGQPFVPSMATRH